MYRLRIPGGIQQARQFVLHIALGPEPGRGCAVEPDQPIELDGTASFGARQEAREPLGAPARRFANSGGFVFVDESADEVAATWVSIAFGGVGSRPLGGRSWRARCGLCSL